MVTALTLDNCNSDNSKSLITSISNNIDVLISLLENKMIEAKNAYISKRQRELERDAIHDLFNNTEFQIDLLEVCLNQFKGSREKLVKEFNRKSAIEFCNAFYLFPIFQRKLSNIANSNPELKSDKQFTLMNTLILFVDEVCEVFFIAEGIVDKDSVDELNFLDAEIRLILSTKAPKRTKFKSAKDLFESL